MSRERRPTKPVERKLCETHCWHGMVLDQKKGCNTMNRSSSIEECCTCHDVRNKPGLF